MENASKALIIAGGILLSLLIISLLVMFYSDIKELMNTKNNVDITQQVAEFNKQYDVYYRDNLYGSDILSIANKIDDYNKRQAEEQGYSIIDIEVTFKKAIMTVSGNIVEKNEKCNANDIKKKVNDLENKIKDYGSKKVKGKTIAVLSGLRTNELEQFLGGNKELQQEVEEYRKNYLSYNSALTNLKSKKFSAKKYEYDKNNRKNY